ncbi:MAG: histidine kinase [Gallionella sp.]|jgi:two-component system sensor histidine kinase AlgZ
MNEARSIKQNSASDALPNFRNLGVTLRILLIGNAAALFVAILQAGGWLDILMQTVQVAALITPVILSSLLLLWLGQPWLIQLSYWRGVLAVNVLVCILTLFIYYFGGALYEQSGELYFNLMRCVLLGAAACSLMLMYFRLRAKILSHARDDARLQVLRARIRPHFLYNTINAVLGIVRTQPRQAETALEDMADLFRMAMADEQDLVPLGREVSLSRQYLALEQLRMGERLTVDWKIQDVPDDAQVPVLLLQPLLENAVYHGIEPLVEGGCIQVLLRRNGGVLQIVVENPCAPQSDIWPHAGNKIALQNIRERLALLFDAEASYQVTSGSDFYRVEIALPYMREKAI